MKAPSRFKFICLLLSVVLSLSACGSDSDSDSDSDSENEAPVNPGIWELGTPLTSPRADLTSCAIGDEIYVIGGKGRKGQKGVESFNVTTGKWTKKKPLPPLRKKTGPTACVEHDGKFYVFGCTESEVYDPGTDTWSDLPRRLGARCYSTVSVLRDKIYVIGGYSQGYYSTNRVLVYDPALNIWSAATPLPIPVGQAGSETVNDRIYVFGGRIAMIGFGNEKIDKVTNLTHVYNPDTDSWSEVDRMEKARKLFSSAVLDGKIYAFGGVRTRGKSSVIIKIFSNVEEYDPVMNIWENKTDMLYPLTGHTSTVVNQQIYVLGGFTKVKNGDLHNKIAKVAKYHPEKEDSP